MRFWRKREEIGGPEDADPVDESPYAAQWRETFKNARVAVLPPDDDRRDAAEVTVRDALGLEVVGADGEQPMLMYINSEGQTGLIRPALEPEVRMWKMLVNLAEVSGVQ